MIELAIILACILIAFSIGSNDSSNSFGICVGCGLIKFKTAVILLLIFVFLGIFLQGDTVMRTVGRELVGLNEKSLSISLIAASIVIVIANWRRYPLSSHQVIIGSLTGSSLALGLNVNVMTLAKIIVSWVISPISSLFLAVGIYTLLERILSRTPIILTQKIFSALLLTSAVLIAYNTGANELATAIGSVVYYGILTPIQASLIGSISLFLGAYALSRRVIETVGKKIAPLDIFSGFSAQFGAGFSVYLFTIMGMPVSTTYCIVGAVFGIGVLKGVQTVGSGLIKRIAAGWITAPTLSFVICYILGKLV